MREKEDTTGEKNEREAVCVYTEDAHFSLFSSRLVCVCPRVSVCVIRVPRVPPPVFPRPSRSCELSLLSPLFDVSNVGEKRREREGRAGTRQQPAPF